jgi:hypothetical protein
MLGHRIIASLSNFSNSGKMSRFDRIPSFSRATLMLFSQIFLSHLLLVVVDVTLQPAVGR